MTSKAFFGNPDSLTYLRVATLDANIAGFMEMNRSRCSTNLNISSGPVSYTDSPFAFIAISASRMPKVCKPELLQVRRTLVLLPPGQRLLSSALVNDLMSAPETGCLPPGFPPIVNVMLIRREGPIAYRLSIGRVCLDRWKEAEPQVERTLLS